jgi:multiple sugar transport system permease protein
MQHVFDPELHRARLLEAERRARRRGWKRFVPRGWHLVLLPLSVIMVLPFVWMVLSSFMTNAEINHAPPALFPHQLNLAGYNLVLANSDFPRWFLNSVIVSGTVVVSQLIMCSLAGYAFARINFRGRNLTLVLLLATALIPFQLTVIPTFLIFHTLGLINTLGALIVPGLTSALGIYLMSSFFQAFPKELEEAGRIDGCSRLGVYAKIVLPLAKPALAALAIITFIYAWNDRFWPLIAISDRRTRCRSGSRRSGSAPNGWAAVSAGITLTAAPVSSCSSSVNDASSASPGRSRDGPRVAPTAPSSPRQSLACCGVRPRVRYTHRPLAGQPSRYCLRSGAGVSVAGGWCLVPIV